MGLLDGVKFAAIMQIMKMLYTSILRPLLVKAIDDPNEAWDDYILEIVDRVFGYTPDPS